MTGLVATGMRVSGGGSLIGRTRSELENLLAKSTRLVLVEKGPISGLLDAVVVFKLDRPNHLGSTTCETWPSSRIEGRRELVDEHKWRQDGSVGRGRSTASTVRSCEDGGLWLEHVCSGLSEN